MIDGPEFSYALHPLPAGGFGFRRWRWELWRGARLEAAGWRLTQRDAERALRKYAAVVGHELVGLEAPDLRRATAGGVPKGASVDVDSGALRCRLVPRALEDELARVLARSS